MEDAASHSPVETFDDSPTAPTEPTVAETLRHWPGSPGEAEAHAKREGRERTLRTTGLLEDPLDPNIQASFDRVTEQVRVLLGAPAAMFTLIDGHRQVFRAASGFPSDKRETPLAESLCRHVRDSGRDLVIQDLREHPLHAITPGAVENGARAYLGTPIYAPNDAGIGEPVASLCAMQHEPREWTERDLAALRALADGITTRLALMRSLAAERRERARGKEREKELERFFESLPQTVIVWEPGGNVLYASPRSRQLVGVSSETFLSGVWVERIHPEDRSAVLERIAFDPLALTDDRPAYRMMDDEGRYRSLISRTVVRRDDEGETRYITTITDVTAVRATEEALREERERMRAIFDVLPSAFYLVDAEGRVLQMNPSARELLGDATGENAAAFSWPPVAYIDAEGREEPHGPENFLSARARKGESVRESRVLRIRTATGDRYLQGAAEPVRDEEGSVVGAVVTLQDVTELRAAHAAVEAEHRESQRRVEQLLDSMPIFAGLIAPDGTMLFVNEAPLQAVGATRADVVGKVIWEAAWVADDPEAEEALRSIIQEAASGVSVEREVTFRWQGRVLEMQYYAVPIRDEAGRLVALSTSAVDVTAQRAAARAAKDDLARLRDVLDGMTTAVKLFDPDGRLVMANAAAFRAHEAALDEMRGLQMWELPWFAEEDLAEPIKAAIQRAQGGEIARLPVHAGIRGDVHQYETSIVPILHSDGAIAYLLAESVDVTIARRAAAAVEAERAKLRGVIDALPIGLFIFDQEMNVVLSNEEAYRVTDMREEELIERRYHLGAFIEPDGSETPMTHENAPVPRALLGEDARAPRTMRFWREGEPSEFHRFVSIAAAPLVGPDGKVEAAVMTASNVKPLREAEQAVVRERLAGAERIQEVIEAMPIFVGLCDAAGTLLFANRSPLALLGLTLADVENLPIWETPWFTHDAEMAARMREGVRIAQAGRPFRSEFQIATNGELIDVDVWITPIFAPNGKVRYILPSGVDVTERNRAARELQAATDEAQEAQVSAERAKEAAERATRAKDEFLSVLSHELRTPLTPAMLGLELMAADIELIEQTREADPETLQSIHDTFGSVRQNLDLQVRLIDDLLDITRISRGKLELHTSTVDLHEAIQHAIEITSIEAQDKTVRVVFEPGASPSTTEADPARIRQILWNLLANAVKFTPSGGTVTVSTANPTPSTVLVTVCDTGRGIAPGQTEAIFNAFEQGGVGVTRDFGGLGLGLAISRSLAHAHGATLVARSEGMGRGACFDLTMAASASSREATAEPDQPIRAPGGRPARVLLVEDNPDTARMTAELLRRNGATVVVAHSVRQAVALAEDGDRWEVLLTDLGLPDGDGIEVLKRLRAIVGPLPAVAMSGFGTEDDKRRTREAGFRAHLVKPITFSRVRDALQDALV